jgi:hypothetical protein
MKNSFHKGSHGDGTKNNNNRIAIIATKPLTEEDGWIEMKPNELLLFHKGTVYNCLDTVSSSSQDVLKLMETATEDHHHDQQQQQQQHNFLAVDKDGLSSKCIPSSSRTLLQHRVKGGCPDCSLEVA